MGVFVNELKKRGGYVYGSRALGVPTESSDWDWCLELTTENEMFLTRHGFKRDACPKTGIRSGRYPSKTRTGLEKPVTELPGLTRETLVSYRKGNTNVVLMTPMLLQATKFATKMAAAEKDTGSTSTKEGRILAYQKYSMMFAGAVKS